MNHASVESNLWASMIEVLVGAECLVISTALHQVFGALLCASWMTGKAEAVGPRS